MRTLFLFSTFILVIAGCSNKETKAKEPTISSSFNAEFEEWTSTYQTKKSDHAHSGERVAYVDAATVYSLGYLKSLGNLGKQKVDSIVFSYWAYCNTTAIKAQTVLSIDKADNSKNSYWTSSPVEAKLTETNKWIRISETFKLPANLDATNVLKLYVWNNSKEEMLLDDFKVDFY